RRPGTNWIQEPAYDLHASRVAVEWPPGGSAWRRSDWLSDQAARCRMAATRRQPEGPGMFARIPASSLGRGRTSTPSLFLGLRANIPRRGTLGDHKQALSMKITKLTVYQVPPRWLFLRIDTDTGPSGWGEPVVEGRAHTVAAAVDELADYLVGKDPRHIEDHWNVLYRGGFYRGGPVLMSAIAGIDQALWDIKGKDL